MYCCDTILINSNFIISIIIIIIIIVDVVIIIIVGDATGGYSNEFSFKSAPLSSQQLKNFTFAVFADLGKIHFQLFYFQEKF